MEFEQIESEPEEILSSLHQLVKNVEPIIKESDSVEAAEDAIFHLEETDENFHKYDFVRHIRNQLESSMGHLIDEEIEKNSMGNSLNATSGQETLVQFVTKSVSESKEFSTIVRKLCNETLGASEVIIQNIEDERLSAIGEEDSNSQPSRRHQSVFSDGGSTYDHALYFLSQEQFHLIAEEMDSQQPLSVRREALKRLCQVPPSDVMASESWSQLRVSLMAALADTDAHIAHDALSFHAKMFAVSNHQITRETYTCLAEHLRYLFVTSMNETLPSITDGLDITQPEVVHILKRIRLLNEFQRQVPSIWVRYPETFLEAIVESTLSIIVLHPRSSRGGSKELISPLHFFSLVDTKANWMKKWLHGNYSRCVVIKQMQEEFQTFLEDAVDHCISFCGKCRAKQSNMEHLLKKMKQHKIIEEKRRTRYTPAELEHLTFIHSLCVVGRILLYLHGRELFPVRIKSGTKVSIQTLVVAWIQVLGLAKHKPKSDQKTFEPALLVGKALRTLCSSSAFVESCINSEIIDALLSPVKTWLIESPSHQVDHDVRASEAAMLHIAEILACLSSTVPGRNVLMYGTSDKHAVGTRKFSAAAHVVAEFAQRALRGNLPFKSHQSQSYLVTGAFVFVCRQMYNTCEGLALLQEYRLHEYIAKTWKQIHDKRGEVSTPTGSEEGDSLDLDASGHHLSQNLLLWEENLIDNLLNYAATPKGLLLLQQTGAINECVFYMYMRYRKKLQVSKCEKFGYGVMVTQVAATAPGIVALQLAGFEKALVHELWAGLECASDEIRMTAPPPHPISPIDRSVHKCFIGLVNILSSFDAVFHVFHKQKLPNNPSYSFREKPDSVVKVVDRLVMINSEAKVHSLFNYEQSHVFGLRLLNVLSCCLDTWLLLETQYNVQQALLQMQKDDCTFEGNIIIDALSVERNHILVRTQAIGGPSERRLPPREPENLPPTHKASKQNLYPWPLFNKFPLPKEYTPNLATKPPGKKESVISRFLSKTKAADKNRSWLDKCRNEFQKTIISSPGVIRGSVLAELLEKAVTAQERMPEERVFPNQSIKDNQVVNSLNPITSVGIKMVVRYGKHLHLVKSNTEATTANLTHVLQQCRAHLEDQQERIPDDKLSDINMKTLQGPYHGFDWFASTVFLMMGGNKDKTWSFLQKLSDLLCSGFIWPARLHASIHLPKEMRLSGIHPLFSHIGHHVELILQNELPLVHSTFRMCGYTPSQICQHWLKQCFWNYMDWTQIIHYVAVVIIMGTDYQVYICISILKHLQDKILEHRLTQDLQVLLKENAFANYTVSSSMGYMKELEGKYRQTVLPDLRSIAGKMGK